jgi:hypothetical protein
MSKKDWFGLGLLLMVIGGTAFLLPMIGLQWEIIDVFGGGGQAVAGLAFAGGAVLAVCNKEN